MEYRNNFAANLAALRKQRGLSLVTLGEAVGVTDEAIRLMEKGKRSPSFEILCALADYFRVSIDGLVGHAVGEYQTGDCPGYGDYACMGPVCALDASGGYTVHIDDGEPLPKCPRCRRSSGWVKF